MLCVVLILFIASSIWPSNPYVNPISKGKKQKREKKEKKIKNKKIKNIIQKKAGKVQGDNNNKQPKPSTTTTIVNSSAGGVLHYNQWIF